MAYTALITWPVITGVADVMHVDIFQAISKPTLYRASFKLFPRQHYTEYLSCYFQANTIQSIFQAVSKVTLYRVSFMLFPRQHYTEYFSCCFQGNTIQIKSIYHPWKWAPMFFNTLVKFHISNHIIPSSCPQGYSHTHMEQPENEGGRSKVSNRPSAWLANKSRGIWATIWHFTRTICQCSHTYNSWWMQPHLQ